MTLNFLDEKTKRKFKLYKAIAKKWFLLSCARIAHKKRDAHFVKNEYGRVWGPSSFLKDEKPYAQELADKLVFWSSVERRKFVISYFSKALQGYTNVTSVLEVGSGNGANILALAVMHPEIKEWHGVELTPEGVAAAKGALASPPLAFLGKVTGLPSKEITERLSRAEINFIQGDMTRLPFEDGIVDVAFSCQAIEQLPDTYVDAFKEAGRVSKKYAFFLEEFKEAQRNMFEKIHLKNVNYFRASYRELEKLNFTVLAFEKFPLRPLHYGLGFVSAVVSK